VVWRYFAIKLSLRKIGLLTFAGQILRTNPLKGESR